MTVKSGRMNRAVVSGGIFILMMTGVAFTVGACRMSIFTRKWAVRLSGGAPMINNLILNRSYRLGWACFPGYAAGRCHVYSSCVPYHGYGFSRKGYL